MLSRGVGAWSVWKEINRGLRTAVGKADSEWEIHLRKSSASLCACLQEVMYLHTVMMYCLCITANYFKMTITTINM